MSQNKDAVIRKQEIMQAALKLFISKGYENTSTNDILQALNLSRGGLYHHFSSKKEILDSAIEMTLQFEISKIEAMMEDNRISAIDKLKYLIEFTSPPQSMIDDVRTIIHSKDNPTLVTHLLRKKLEFVTPLFLKIAEQGRKEGVFHCEYPQEVSKIAVILSTLLFSDTIMTMSSEEFNNMVIVFQTAIEAIAGAEPGTLDFMRQSIKLGN